MARFCLWNSNEGVGDHSSFLQTFSLLSVHSITVWGELKPLAIPACLSVQIMATGCVEVVLVKVDPAAFNGSVYCRTAIADFILTRAGGMGLQDICVGARACACLSINLRDCVLVCS